MSASRNKKARREAGNRMVASHLFSRKLEAIWVRCSSERLHVRYPARTQIRLMHTVDTSLSCLTVPDSYSLLLPSLHCSLSLDNPLVALTSSTFEHFDNSSLLSPILFTTPSDSSTRFCPRRILLRFPLLRPQQCSPF